MNISDILILGPEILLIIYALMSILFASFVKRESSNQLIFNWFAYARCRRPRSNEGNRGKHSIDLHDYISGGETWGSKSWKAENDSEPDRESVCPLGPKFRKRL